MQIPVLQHQDREAATSKQSSVDELTSRVVVDLLVWLLSGQSTQLERRAPALTPHSARVCRVRFCEIVLSFGCITTGLGSLKRWGAMGVDDLGFQDFPCGANGWCSRILSSDQDWLAVQLPRTE